VTVRLVVNDVGHSHRQGRLCRLKTLDRLGLGLAALGRPAYLNLGREQALPARRDPDAMRAASWEVLDEAYAAGIRWVDAARSYGRAEEFLAGWLDARGHRDVTVSSKWGYTYVADWCAEAEVHEIKEHSPAMFRRQWAETRQHLDDRVALYQVHSLTLDSPLLHDHALLAELARLTDVGVRAGFSTSGPAQAEVVRRAAAIEVGGRRLFDAVQSTWNVLEPSAGPALAEAHAAGLRVLVKEALANGRLAMHPPEPMARLARRHRVEADAVALAAVLAQPWADVVLSGASGVGQLRSNLAADGLHVDVAEFAECAERTGQYWATRAGLTWN